MRSPGRGTVDDGVRYELKTVKAIRGTQDRSIAKWQKDGWELVSQSAGTLHTTLNFRRPKPPLPTRQIVLGGAIALILAGIIGVGALLEGNGDGKGPQSSKPTPPVATKGSDSPPAKITNITVDELLDKLNSANMGGIKVGDRFRLTGELFESDAWGTGASGDYSVMLKAKSGADDLMVFVNKSDADGWQDGTKVEMVVTMVEETINGETTDGWLKAQSVKTVSGA